MAIAGVQMVEVFWAHAINIIGGSYQVAKTLFRSCLSRCKLKLTRKFYMFAAVLSYGNRISLVSFKWNLNLEENR